VYYEPASKKTTANKNIVRLGLIQWQMRLYKDMDELMQQAEFFVDTVSGYRSDFALFPEFFHAPLMRDFNHLSEPEAIRELAKKTDELVKRFAELAITYNINIITGSMPEIVNGMLYNVGYLCKRDGGIERYEKIHVTPNEAKVWGLQGGNIIKTFDTDCGKIGILICYDVEFPELSRIVG
jgi:predicted amidohydrolase